MEKMANHCRVWTEVDCEALRANAGYALALSGVGAELMAVVKANAYGHGVGIVVPALRDLASAFAVANLTEAREVRASAGDGPDILLMSPCLPGERDAVVEAGLIPVISGEQEASAYADVARSVAKPTRLHVKFDTGMGRIGIWHEDAESVCRAIADLKNVEVHSVSTHLPSADDDEDFTRAQLAGFDRLMGTIRGIFPEARVHALNSAGVLRPGGQAYDLVRAGLMLYGSAPMTEHQPSLRPVLTWKARVGLVRDVPAGRTVGYGRTFVTPRAMRLATVTVGYADGYPRRASGRGAEVLIGGRRCPVVGRVTMDQIVVASEEADLDAEVVLIGRQGTEEILAAELAQWADTIAWDIFTGIGGRTIRLGGEVGE